jgi:hypothetical protein
LQDESKALAFIIAEQQPMSRINKVSKARTKRKRVYFFCFSFLHIALCICGHQKEWIQAGTLRLF